SGTLGSADSRLVTVEVIPAAVSVVASDSVVRPVQVTVPVTETDEPPVVTWTVPVQEADTEGLAAWSAAACAAAGTAIPNMTTPQTVVTQRAKRLFISRAFRSRFELMMGAHR